jgi:hypothetical protein
VILFVQLSYSQLFGLLDYETEASLVHTDFKSVEHNRLSSLSVLLNIGTIFWYMLLLPIVHCII